jgi:hypothetical protein
MVWTDPGSLSTASVARTHGGGNPTAAPGGVQIGTDVTFGNIWRLTILMFLWNQACQAVAGSDFSWLWVLCAG